MVYRDKRGWLYKVMPSIGGDRWKAWYCKPGRNDWHSVAILDWRSTETEAEADLAAWAVEKGMTTVEDLK